YRSFYLKELLKPNFFVYYSRDRLTSTPYYKNHGIRLESEIMKKADLVCCNSEYLAVLASEHNSNSKDIGQGCDTEMFDAEQARVIPDDIIDIKRPIIGYAGALKSSRLDSELLEKIALVNPDWSIVLVGPEDAYFLGSNLHNLKNVHFTGSKPMNELPQYISAFDVALNPQHINDITIGNYPRKIDEYLVLGKKIVATKTETMKMFADYVYLAKGAEEYIEMISQALAESDESLKQSRISFAKEHTWKNNVMRIYKEIEQTINR
ncbi:MAG: glycosyltransferase, partial [Bacteroidota bacterium]|nr:glycosyltransferase [Bacteroidota bacterium]